jgi:hypothetical protein
MPAVRSARTDTGPMGSQAAWHEALRRIVGSPSLTYGPMKVVVTTPTRHVGSRVVQLLLQAGVRPTLLARHPARLDSRVLERADVVRTDLADSDAVVRATRDADALFWLAPFITDPDADPVA